MRQTPRDRIRKYKARRRAWAKFCRIVKEQHDANVALEKDMDEVILQTLGDAV